MIDFTLSIIDAGSNSIIELDFRARSDESAFEFAEEMFANCNIPDTVYFEVSQR